MKCHICHQDIKQRFKEIKGVNIFNCERCKLAMIDNKHVNGLKNVYNLEAYRDQENRYKTRFLKLSNHVLRFVDAGMVLDIGSGFGLFASILASRGNFNIDVVEPGPRPYYLRQNKIKCFKSNFESFIPKSRTKYSVVLLMDVLEHFRNPFFSLKKIKSLLEKDGLLVLQTPNVSSIMARICKNWSWWMVEDHKYLFSPKSIKLLLLETGYEIIFLKTYEDFIDFKKNLDGNFESIKFSLLRKFTKLLFFSVFIPSYFLFRSLIWRFGYGGLIFLIAKKRYNTFNEN